MVNTRTIINEIPTDPPEYHHLSSFDNSKKEDSFLDECYLKNSENLVDDTLKSVSETPNSQVRARDFIELVT